MARRTPAIRGSSRIPAELLPPVPGEAATTAGEYWDTQAAKWRATRIALELSAPAFAREREHKLIKSLNAQPGDWLLDGGCGSGYWAQKLLDHGYNIVALDHSAAMARTAKMDVPRLEIVRGEITSIPLASSRFHAAISILVIDFVTDPLRALAELHRVVKPEGTLVLDVLGALSKFGETIG